jgi:hypothetical protein
MELKLTKKGNVVLTTDHAASSYGQPVLVWDGVAYGPDDVIDYGDVAQDSQAGMLVLFPRGETAARFVRGFGAHADADLVKSFLAMETR